jgi:hypothetical protein
MIAHPVDQRDAVVSLAFTKVAGITSAGFRAEHKAPIVVEKTQEHVGGDQRIQKVEYARACRARGLSRDVGEFRHHMLQQIKTALRSRRALREPIDVVLHTKV